MADIFISYIHEEERAAKAVQGFLKTKFENQQKAFLSGDHWQIFAGEVWLDRIRDELNSSKVVLLMLSTKSVKRPWVNFEAGAAWLTNKAVIPVCFGGLRKDRLPKPYSGMQALDLFEEAGYLLQSVAHHLSLLGGPVPTDETTDRAFKVLRDALSSVSHTGKQKDKNKKIGW
jgi:hypothetical protein